MGITWNQGPKFYGDVEWLRYMILHFFEPWKIVLNGTVDYIGESCFDDCADIDVYNDAVRRDFIKKNSDKDVGSIVIKDNVVFLSFIK